MGSYSYSFSPFTCWFSAGAYCSIATGVELRGINHPYERWTTSPITYDKGAPEFAYTKIAHKPAVKHLMNLPKVENDVWIGRGALLAPNITLGAGCVVAARSNVIKSVPPYAIVGGNPAKIIKYRFNGQTIVELMQSRWWEYDVTQMTIPGDYGPHKFLDEFYKWREDLPLLKMRKFKDVLDELNIPYEKA